MPIVNFGRADEPGFELKASDDMIAVRTHSRRSLRGGPVPSAAEAGIADAQLVVAFPEAGVEVYRVPRARGGRSLGDRKAALRLVPDVQFAGGVLEDPQSGEPVLYTENLFIKFVDVAEPDRCREVLRQAGLTIKNEPTYATNAFFAAAPEDTGQKVFDIAQQLLRRDDVEFCHPELVRERAAKAIAPQQWHLRATTLGGIAINAGANVEAAHRDSQGEGITIAVIDDGFDVDHPEFNRSGKVVSPRDATEDSADPRPKDLGSPDDHGTACAGVACADGRGGASGVAPKARLMPIRLASGLGSQREAAAFRFAADNGADVISCSWGPPDGRWWDADDPRHARVVQLPASTRLAIDYATSSGRGGKGCVVLFAAGNGNEPVENDGYASYERVIAVAACNDRGKRSVYSDFGAPLWCAFPSSDFGHPPFNHPEPLTPGIWTTDRSGTANGYNPRDGGGDPEGHYTDSFGGTSSSCPGAAGVAALVLSANPDLRREDVRDILRRCCDPIDPQGGSYDAEGRSRFFGFGRLNAASAVELARPRPGDTLHLTRVYNRPIPDLGTVGVSLEVGEPSPVESLSVSVDIAHTYVGDLVLTLIPPPSAGSRRIVLHDRLGGSSRNLRMTYDAVNTPALSAFRGKPAQGTWQLEIRDAAARDTGTLTSFGLSLAFSTPADRNGQPAPASSLAAPAPAPPRRTRRPGTRSSTKS
ncbi:Calcium-dependent protease precursor [Tautonia plasticadhaerens]|uniref:Calcium-dependent protease n=1 Tax=Tautonia plasticadhaerens TaxID=2527974 RepID=A0A518HDW5_9BACT|nr:S8 family serine peptidase [Tautonia plasticadhaerens]QDV39052.1 Calcium-dependent protease precursor [Tautonia plasticadhaerens]